MWSLILYSLFQGVPKFRQSQILKCFLVGIFHGCGKMRRVYLCAGAVWYASQIRPTEEWCQGSLFILCFSLIFLSVLYFRQCSLCGSQQLGQVSSQLSLFADMKIHFSSELEVNLLKASGVCGVCVSTAIVRMLTPWQEWAARGAAAGAALTCGEAIGARCSSHWCLFLLAPPKPWGDAWCHCASSGRVRRRDERSLVE